MSNSGSQRSSRERQLDALIADYYQSVERGEPVNQAAVLAAHPDFAVELQEFLADVGHMDRMAPPETPELDVTRIEQSSATAHIRNGAIVRYFGEYELLGQLGVGGMGVVYKARQSKLKRIVALKLIKSGELANPQDLQRFEAEARAAARLTHPGIVTVHEVGVFEGQRFYTMDYVEGGSLARLNRDEPVASRRAAELVQQLAEAMHYAHQQGVVHRDLKPANILLTAQGTPQITDFGLAKLLPSDEETHEVTLTETGQILGTAGYMSPEQAAGKARLVGPPADIYALGAVLYALLTSRAPFVGDTLSHTLLQVLHKDPISPRVLNPSVPRDLETICLKCLEKEPHKRYGTAQLLAEDLARFLSGRPVVARPIGALGRSWRWCQRNPVVAGLLVTVVASLLIGTGVSLYYAGQEREARLDADKRKSEAIAISVVAEQRRIEAEAAKQRAIDSERQARWQLYVAQMTPLGDAFKNSEWGRLDQLLLESTPTQGSPDFRGWEWHYLRAQADRISQPLNPSCKYLGICAFCRHTGQLVVSRQDEQGIEVWDIASRQRVRTFPQHLGGISQYEWSPDGSLLAYTGHRQGVVVVNAVTGEIVHDARFSTSDYAALSWSKDGELLAVGRFDGSGFWVFDTKTWHALEIPPSLRQMKVRGLAFHPDNRQLAIAGDGQLQMWTISDTEPVSFPWPEGLTTSLAWNPIGNRIALSNYGSLIIGDAAGRILHNIPQMDNGGTTVAWIDDDHVLIAGMKQTIETWNATTSDRVREMRLHGSPVGSIVPCGLSGEVVTASGNGEVRFWNARESHSGVHDKNVSPDALNDLAWSDRGQELFVAQSGGQVSRWDAVSGERIATWKLPTDQTITSLTYSAGELACVQAGGEIYIVNESGVPLRHGGRPVDRASSRSISWSPDRSRIAFVDADQGARIIDANTLDEVWKSSRDDCLHALFSPRGDRVAVSSFGSLELIDATDFSPASPSAYSGSGAICQVAWSPDGKQVAEANIFGRVFIYDSTEMKLLHVLERHSGPVVSVQWSPDGRRIATASHDATVRIWDATTFVQLVVLSSPAPPSIFTRVAWSPDGQRLAATTASGRLIISR